MTLRILADDLTGALDAAAPFATADNPVQLVLNKSIQTGARLTLSTESRDLSEDAAIAAVLDGFETLTNGATASTVWFKKVDSVIRGHTLVETLAMARTGRFKHCIFAPAFPSMGRITRQGRQLIRNGSGEWIEAPPGDLRQAFAALVPRLAPGLQLAVCDAESQADLVQAVRPWQGESGVLWAGSRGLAEALVTKLALVPRPPVGLFILGTSHSVTRAQALALKGRVRPVPKGEFARPSADAPVLVDPVPWCRSGAETRAAVATALESLDPPSDGSAVFVTGGDCQAVVLATTGATGAACLGEIGPGLPLSRIIGGRWDGTVMISKSGGFGEPGLLKDFLRSG